MKKDEVTIFKVADLFAGAGGTATGAEKAVKELDGEIELVAVNHWDRAIETHTLNHPTARHYIEDVDIANPEELVPEGYLDLLMASPECTYHSRARGGKPIKDQGRMNPFVIHRWITLLDVRCLLVENVPEYVHWGPLLRDGRPDPAHKGEYFQAWFRAIQDMGYTAEWKLLNAADYGDATTRIRFFLIARKDGKPITWPAPSHSANPDADMLGHLPHWRAAREIIDWDNTGRSLLDDPKYLRTPLSINTRRRIARGLEKFGGSLAPLYIQLLGLEGVTAGTNSDKMSQPFVMGKQGHSPAYRAVDKPIPTATTDGRSCLIDPTAEPLILGQHKGVVRSSKEPIPTCATHGGISLVETKVEPFIMANRSNNVPRGMDQPIHTITAENMGNLYKVSPTVEPFVLGQQSCSAARSTKKPIPTVSTDGAISLTSPLLVKYYGTGICHSPDEPVSTLTAKSRIGVANSMVIPFRGKRAGQKARVHSIDEPLPTVTTEAGLALANPAIIPYYGDHKGKQEPRAHSIDEPLRTVTAEPRFGLANPVLVEVNHAGGDRVSSVEKPLGAVTSKRGRAVVTPFMVQWDQQGGGDRAGVRSVNQPVPTIITKQNTGVVKPEATMLIEPILKRLEEGDIDPQRLVMIDGEPFLLDIRFRMLTNQELAKAMGFTDAETTYEFAGNISEVTRQIGNAVPVNLAAALVKSIFQE